VYVEKQSRSLGRRIRGILALQRPIQVADLPPTSSSPDVLTAISYDLSQASFELESADTDKSHLISVNETYSRQPKLYRDQIRTTFQLKRATEIQGRDPDIEPLLTSKKETAATIPHYVQSLPTKSCSLDYPHQANSSIACTINALGVHRARGIQHGIHVLKACPYVLDIAEKVGK